MSSLTRRQEWVCQWSLRASPWWEGAWSVVGGAIVAAAWLGDFGPHERLFMAAVGGAILGHALALSVPTSLPRLIAGLYRERQARGEPPSPAGPS